MIGRICVGQPEGDAALLRPGRWPAPRPSSVQQFVGQICALDRSPIMFGQEAELRVEHFAFISVGPRR
jgi:hypothetical protein